jgi:membrane protein implicated in regulation of membrane protease activity
MKKRWRTGIRYVVFQIPSWALLILILTGIDHWVDLPTWVMGAIVALWLTKDAVLFPFVWRSYNRSRISVHFLVGTEGEVEERLAPSSYVRVHGELWHAQIMGKCPPIEKREIIRIDRMRGLTLLVVPKDPKMEKFDESV